MSCDVININFMFSILGCVYFKIMKNRRKDCKQKMYLLIYFSNFEKRE